MGEFLFNITDRFHSGHGLLVTPAVGRFGGRLRVGMSLVLVRPDGSRLERPAFVLSPAHGPGLLDPWFAVFTDLTEAEVPVGTAVWSAG